MTMGRGGRTWSDVPVRYEIAFRRVTRSMIKGSCEMTEANGPVRSDRERARGSGPRSRSNQSSKRRVEDRPARSIGSQLGWRSDDVWASGERRKAGQSVSAWEGKRGSIGSGGAGQRGLTAYRVGSFGGPVSTYKNAGDMSASRARA